MRVGVGVREGGVQPAEAAAEGEGVGREEAGAGGQEEGEGGRGGGGGGWRGQVQPFLDGGEPGPVCMFWSLLCNKRCCCAGWIVYLKQRRGTGRKTQEEDGRTDGWTHLRFSSGMERITGLPSTRRAALIPAYVRERVCGLMG